VSRKAFEKAVEAMRLVLSRAVSVHSNPYPLDEEIPGVGYKLEHAIPRKVANARGSLYVWRGAEYPEEWEKQGIGTREQGLGTRD
jgi:hypothetical protein